MSLLSNSVFKDTSPFNTTILPYGVPLQTGLSPASYENWSMRFNKNAQPLYVNERIIDFNFRGNDFTIETWVNVDDFSATNLQTGDTKGYCLFSTLNKETGSGIYLTLKVNKGNNIIPQQTAVCLYHGNELVVCGNIPEVTLANWFHISVTRRDSVQFIIHINGKVVTTVYKSVDIICEQPLCIGGFYFQDDTYAEPFVGYLASLRVSNIARYNNIDYTLSNKFISDTYTTLLLFQTPFLRDESKEMSSNNTIQMSEKVQSQYVNTLYIPGTVPVPFSPHQPTRNYSPSLHGGSVELNGSSCLVTQTTSFNFSASSWSMEAWFKPHEFSENTENQVIFSTYGGSGNTTPGLTLGLYYDTLLKQVYMLFEYIGEGTDVYSKSYPLANYGVFENVWSHVSVIYKNNLLDHGPGTYTPGDTVLMLYVNGKPLTIPDTTFNFNVINTVPTVGSTTNGAVFVNFFKGNIAGVRVSTAAYKNDVLCTFNTSWSESFTPRFLPPLLTQHTLLLLNFENSQSFDKSGKNTIQLFGQVKDSSIIKKFQANSYELDGSSSYIHVTPYENEELTFIRDFTIELWCYCQSISHAQNPGIFQTSANASDYLLSRNTGIALYCNTTDNTYTISLGKENNTGNTIITPLNAPILLNTWQHIAITRNNGSINFFLNGSKKQTTNVKYDYPIVATSLYIGRFFDPLSTFKGYIDNFRITKGYTRYTDSFMLPSQPFNIN